ncbi:CD225/dispanin family protein [Streptomyces caniscabiei]|nr:CD225/dispanin family protein [Streptomyces caniscabiei]MDX3515995.1 CD225/dispanin family protein [Streptomyces caniscabiei]MDX3723640.1 CD225/dispanin family protein [Streptomyces caniscabiei]MDX3733704.1 CD225/dispanin family protein [Streptomyces caniscabiei]WEO24003.1 CD225/dispanin family protein [Streptomyces caniscabiei]
MADKHQVPPPDDEDWGERTSWQDSSFPPHPDPHTPPPQAQQQQWGQNYAPQRPVPESYMTPAILVTLLCFLPTGIAAIVFASQVSAKATTGDYQGAAQASRRARILVLVSVGIGVLFWLILIIAMSASDTSTEYMPVP